MGVKDVNGYFCTLHYVQFLVIVFFCFYIQLRNVGGLSPLVQLLKSINAEVRRNASWAISVCANDEITALELCNAR